MQSAATWPIYTVGCSLKIKDRSQIKIKTSEILLYCYKWKPANSSFTKFTGLKKTLLFYLASFKSILNILYVIYFYFITKMKISVCFLHLEMCSVFSQLTISEFYFKN